MDNIIAIGALGGSGTRAIAQVLIEAGIYMGDDLNKPNDNLLFTRLFKNPEWYKASGREDKIRRLLVFEEYMKTNKLSIKTLKELYKASLSNSTFSTKKIYYAITLFKLITKNNNRDNWGWKEPNTQIYVEELFDCFPHIKYIHVLRNGLDMAFSDNKQQLFNWGFKYGIELNGNENEKELAIKQLDYWIASTKDVLFKTRKFQNQFLLVNHTEFCNNPVEQINRLVKFCEIPISDKKLQELYKIPENTGSNDRYQKYDLTIFGKTQLDFVREMGFNIPVFNNIS